VPSGAPSAKAQSTEVSDTYRIKRGDTLGAIARRWKPEGVSYEQMLVGLFQTNRPVFIRDNINLIRAGRDDLPSRPRRHARNWRGRRSAPGENAHGGVQQISRERSECGKRLEPDLAGAARCCQPPSGREEIVARDVSARRFQPVVVWFWFAPLKRRARATGCG
jgi:hypothetical protein